MSVAATPQESPVVTPAAVPKAGQGWFKCIAYTGWGFVEVGATVAGGPSPWAIAGAISLGGTVDQAHKACGWNLMTSNIGFQAFCGSKFIGFSPQNGKPMYDNRGANKLCEIPPTTLDDLYCRYFKLGSQDACVNQWLYDQLLIYMTFGAPFYVGSGGGGGGGGSW